MYLLLDWQVLVQCKYVNTTWDDLKDVKYSYTVQLDEYASENNYSDKPDFAWWVKYVIKKRNKILSKVKSNYWVRPHKYGIIVSKNVKETKQIDTEDEKKLWWDVIMLEMNNVRPEFELYKGDNKDLVGYQEIKFHCFL